MEANEDIVKADESIKYEPAEVKLVLPLESKRAYLEKLRNEVIKILYVIENEQKTQESALGFIAGLLFEVNSANQLFNNQLIKVIVKLNGIKENYKNIPFADVRKQVFEARGIVDFVNKNLK